ncbi:MAG: chromosome segregation protein SMC [Planctomycetota bacterium]|jgi:chromosome segregation protein
MRLKKIVLDGFKSFADKTEFNFDTPVTVIVGPNGCGKSNVVDAVKWVLGEQRVKSLRSDQMADVIFGGSSSRKPAGAADVSLIISNVEGDGNGQLPIDSNEVQITRRIYKSGESEYLINNKVSRLKDIRELFMDTGVGARAYSIIEQGQIEQILTASSVDRRAVFEEAAGISKYKAHKKEAMRKLERTEQNLLRLADILGEVQKQLRSIKYQAGKARNYLAYTERLKSLQVRYWLSEYHQIKTAGGLRNAELEKLEDKIASTASEIGKRDAEVSELGQAIIDKEHEFSKAGNCLVSIESKIEQRMQQIEFLKSRVVELSERKETAAKRLQELQEQKISSEEDLERYSQERIRCEQQHKENNEKLCHVEQELGTVTSECASLEAELEDEKSGIIDIVRRTAQLHNELQGLSTHRDTLSNQKERLADRSERARQELESFLSEKAQYKARFSDIEKVLGQLEESLDLQCNKQTELDEMIESDKERLVHSKEAKSALNGELSILIDMEKKGEGVGQAVKDILAGRAEGHFDYVSGLLAECVNVDVEYANAVEAALNGKSDSVIVDVLEQLMDDKVKGELEGRVNFLCLDRVEPFVDNIDLTVFEGVKGRVVEFVEFEGKFACLMWKLLGKVIIVDSLERAMELNVRIGNEYSFVTLKGEYFSGIGDVRLGPLGKKTGLISRKSRIRQLEETISKITGELSEIETRIDQSTQNRVHMEKRCKELRTAIYEANTQKMQVSSKMSAIEQDIKRLQEEQPLLSGEIGMLEEQISKSVQEEYDSKQKLQELEIVNDERNAQIKELESRYTEGKERLKNLTDELTELKVTAGQVSEQSKAIEQTIASIEEQLKANHGGKETADKEVGLCISQSQTSQRDILNCESEISQLYSEKDKSKENRDALSNTIQELMDKKKEIQELLRQKRVEHEEIEQKASEVKITLSQLEVKEQDLVERVTEELQMDLAAAYQDYEEQEVNWDAIKEEITELRGKIERLGNVNLDAIDEQDALEQRNEFLTNQVADLNQSKHQLQQLINRLNKKSREKFIQTFEEVRVNFQEIFRKLFGGGKADIILEEADDVLEAGIDIIAKPPGKEPRSITLLSGGEKSMTAIALLFSIFKTKPSPFCFLDEIDAALDEANNERFNIMLEEFQRESQFIIITHSKRTMSIADVLFGITMQRRGVSKKISVQFDQFEQFRETAAVA